ncbi:MBOAT family protein [Bradyrhizobium sp. WYCCWR 13023]|uniref:Probable alginate O-acetylase AlgI n=1 Tax=Bradyrhizobium zhengyangense TaxID=2911009 RepID=A0A9X1R792_9BRAD|nr:MBOAT family O-acyltransferase [Bradyrhizobium zhengyangense]MCG2626681.1 MBOAT family protein [Bradyrhizobium zhengyangense]
MLFNSLEFLCIFLPVTLTAIGVAARFHSRLLILSIVCLASAVFYGIYSVWHLALLCGMIALNWILAAEVERSARYALTIGVVLNLAVLVVFKYTGFALRQIFAANVAIPFWAISFPLAISFYTFHQISFLVDVWRKRARRPDLLTYATYVLLFPQLIAGPIVRYSEVAFQLGRQVPVFVRARFFRIGFILLVLGLGKKVLIADALGPDVDAAFANAFNLSTVRAWQAAIGFGFQIYFDFSGYTDMAIGMALMMGLRLPRNFNAPYRAATVSEFWRRWHMTLSRFLRDYLFKSLGGSRRGLARNLVNLMIVMLLGGLWHGPNWTFVVWGGLHGVYLVAHRLWSKFSPLSLPIPIAWLLTYLCVTLAWVFFRAPNFEIARGVLGRMIIPTDGPSSDTAAIMIGIAAALTWLAPQARALAVQHHHSRVVAFLIGAIASASVLTMISTGHADAFIYFAF